MEEFVGSSDLTLLVHLADGDEEPQRRQDGQEVAQLAGVPVRDLHRVDDDGDASSLAQDRGDLIGVAPADDEEVGPSHAQASEALAQRRAGGLLDRDVEHRAWGAVEDAGREGALTRSRRTREHHQRLAPDHNAGTPGELLDTIGLAHEVGGGGDLEGAVDLCSSTSPESVDAARLSAARAPRRLLVVAVSADVAPPDGQRGLLRARVTD